MGDSDGDVFELELGLGVVADLCGGVLMALGADEFWGGVEAGNGALLVVDWVGRCLVVPLDRLATGLGDGVPT